MANEKFDNTYGVFIQLPQFKPQVSVFMTSFVKKEDLSKDKDDPIEDDPHVTVHLGIPLDKNVDLTFACLMTSQFEITVDKFKVFSNSFKDDNGTLKEFDVLVREIKSKELLELHQRISKATGKKWHFDEFIPHMTYGYLKYKTGEKYAKTFNSLLVTNKEMVTELNISKWNDHSNDRTIALSSA